MKPPSYYEGAAEQAELHGHFLEAILRWDDAYSAATGDRSRLRYARRSKEAHLRAIEEWNRRYPEGTPVRFWPGVREGKGRLSRTRSKAWLVSDHASVLVDDYSGGICLTHVEPVLDTEQGGAAAAPQEG